MGYGASVPLSCYLPSPALCSPTQKSFMCLKLQFFVSLILHNESPMLKLQVMSTVDLWPQKILSHRDYFQFKCKSQLNEFYSGKIK